MSLPNEISVNLGLPAAPLTTNPEMLSELQRVYNSIRAVAKSLDAYTGILGEDPAYWSQTGVSRCSIGLNSKIYVEAGEAIGYGNLVSINGSGLAMLADDAVLRCFGFCSAVDGVLLGDYCEIQLLGIYPAFPAATLTPGDFYYLSTNPGQLGIAGSGPTWNQIIGFAISDTTLYFNPQY